MIAQEDIVARNVALTNAWSERFVEYVGVVEEFNFCPFSRTTRDRHRFSFVAREGLLRAQDLCELLLEHATSGLEVLLVAFPEDIDIPTFSRRVEESRNQHQQEHGRMTFALEAFLPLELPETLPTSMGDLVRIARHTPCPAVQCTRLSTLERARGDRSDQTKFVDPNTLSAHALSALLSKTPDVDLTTRVHDEMKRNLETHYAEIRARLLQIHNVNQP